MSRTWLATAVVTCTLVLGAPTAVDSARWWRSPRIVAELGLTSSQIAAIDRVYTTMTAESVTCARKSAAARERVRRLLESADAPEETVAAAADALAQADSARRRTRTLMLFRMCRELSPAQRRGLESIASLRRRAVADVSR
jgi:Spy/CpxP family protein refolding chaperone